MFKERIQRHGFIPVGAAARMNITRVEVTPKEGEGLRDVRGDVVRRQLLADYGIEVAKIRSIVGFLIS